MKNEQTVTLQLPKIITNLLLALVITLSALIVLSQANPGLTLPDRDYGIFAYVGKQITLGKLPYIDAWDHKPPAIFYVDALGLWMAHGFRWGIWAIEFSSLFAAIWLSYGLFKKLWGVFPAICGVAVWLIGFNITLQSGNTTEEFPLPLHFLALLLFLALARSTKNYFGGFVLGLAFSISFLFRANNAMVETAIVLTLLLMWIGQRDYLGLLFQLIAMAVGALLPILISVLYFWSQGALREMFDASITYNFMYSHEKISSASGLVAGFRYLGVIAWIGLIGYGVVLFQWVVNWRSREILTMPVHSFLLVGCPLAVLTVDPAQRNYGHYFINWLPFIGLLSGLLVYTVYNNFPLIKRVKTFPENTYLIAVLGIVLVVFISSGSAVENWNAFRQVLNRTEIERESTIAVYVRDHTQPGDTVLFWGGFPGENLMADRDIPSTYITYPLLVESDFSRKISEHFFVQLKANQPALIVDMGYFGILAIDPDERAGNSSVSREWTSLPSNVFDVLQFIESHYHLETVFRNAKVYRINDDVSTP